MKYRAVIDVSFDDKNDAEKILTIVKDLEQKATMPYRHISKPTVTIEKKIELWECYHDENPPKQCKRIL